MMYRNPRRGLIAALLLAGSGAAAFDDTLPPALEPLPEAAIFAGSANPAMRFRKLGLLARENGDPARAAEFFRCALREDGAENGRPELRDLLHESLLDCGRPEEAAEVLAEAAAAPDMRENLLTAVMTARRNFYAGQKKEARALLEETLRRNGTAAGTARVRALELLARVRNALGDYEEAARSFAELAAWTKEDPPLHWRVLSAAVLNALDGRRNEQAAELLERIETELPESFRRRHHGRIARLRLLADAEQGRFREVEPQYDAMLATARVPDALLGRIAGILARAHAERGEWPRAAELWAAAVKFGDEWFRASALLELMECEAAGGMTERALETLKRYLALYPDAEGRNRLALFEASLHRKLDHSEAADELLRKVYRESGDTGERRLAALELARSAWRAGRSDEAVAMLTFAAANAADAEQRRKIEQRLGECLYRLGRFEEAVKLFAGAAAGSAGAEKETALLWKAQGLYQLKDFEAALRCCETLSESRSEEVRRGADYLRPLLLERLGRNTEAIAGYLQFVERYPKAAEAATALFQAGELALVVPQYDAAELFRRYAGLYPGESAANALYKAHGELLAEGKNAEAAALLAELERQYPKSRYTVGAHFADVDALRENGKFAEALAALDEIARRYGTGDPALQAEIAFDRAVLCERNGDGAGAVKALTRIVEQYADQPIAARAFFMLGDIRARNNDFEAALTLFRQAGERRPGGDFAAGCAGRAADAAFGLYALSKQEKYLKEAQNGYETLLKQPALAPAFAFQARYKLGRCLAASGDAAGAVKCYGDVLYQAAAARRDNNFYAPVWCARSLRAALEVLEAEIREADAVTASECRLEALRLLALARELDLPGENIDAWREHWTRETPR